MVLYRDVLLGYIISTGITLSVAAYAKSEGDFHQNIIAYANTI